MNILLVGHEGYVGAGLVRFLRERHTVVGWGRRADICALDAAALDRHGIEAVVNCAAAMDRVGTAYTPGSESERVNVLGTRQLVAALRGRQIPLVHISTKDVFGDVFGVAQVEEEPERYVPLFRVDDEQPFAPQTVYAKTKLMSEFISEGHARPVVIRLSTCYTDFDHRRGNWLVNMIKSAQAGRPIRVTHNGKQFRDMLHVEDLGRLIEKVCALGRFGLKVNAGGGERNTYSLLQVIRLIDPQARIEFIPGGDYGFAFNNRRAQEAFGWQPEVLFEERIARIKDNIAHGRTADAP
jgi:nucleoside-diphosphate-sugar epimerase